MEIRNVSISDSKAIKDIYNYYIRSTIVSFEEDEISTEEMSSRISTANEKYPWIVACIDNEVIGYTYASQWKSRCAYKYSVEVSVYLSFGLRGMGIGTALYAELINRLKKLGYHTVIGGISLPNEASKKLHEKMGFKKVAEFSEVGYKFDKYINVGYWELILD